MRNYSVALILLMFAVIGIFLSFFPFLYDADINPGVVNRSNAAMTVGNTERNIFWFIQVSDIHISKFYGPDRAPDLMRFCKEHIPAISPDFVIASGDLTDAKTKDGRGSKQYTEEWQRYKEIVTQCQNIGATKWLDIRGNHDSFNVLTEGDPNNLFRRFSSQGHEHPSSYAYHHTKTWGKYSFIAMDACPDPGPRRPFNFFGYMNNRQIQKIKQHIAESMNSNMTIWFGHYPTSLILTENSTGVRYLMRDAVAYLCGHLHTLANLVPNMYARHRSGTLELELGDWKDERRYRVLAIDHDILTFTDETLGEWPVILVTNPKNVMYSSQKDQGHRVSTSTHIRLLVFSPNEITAVNVYIDDEYIGSADPANKELFVLPWKPNKYNSGLHKIKVVAQDSTYRKKEVAHWFAVDGTQSEFPFLPSFILTANIYVLGKLVFWFLVCSYIGILLLLRNCKNINSIFIKSNCECVSVLPRSLVKYINTWILRIWLVSRETVLFYSLNAFMIYVALGPWFVAEIIEGHTGVMFIWGLFVKNTIIPGSLSYFYGIYHIVVYNVPLVMLLGYMMHYIQNQNHKKVKRNNIVLNQVRHIYIPFLAFLIVNGFVAFKEFPAAYGSSALVMGPVRTGSLFLAVILFVKAKQYALNIPVIS